NDAEIARATFLLLERAKVLAEGAGSAPLAGLLTHAGSLPDGPIVAVVSGGNLDPFVLDRILWYGLVAEGRLLRLRTLLGDRPGELNGFLKVAADRGANVRQIHHEREAPGGGPAEVGVEVELEVEGPEHAARLVESYGQSGWTIERIPLGAELRFDRTVTAAPSTRK
ncbi:Threonine dehydratase catabolic, partial [mine drainage metagenome]